MALEIDRLSREYIYWPITTDNDLEGATAEVAFLADPAAHPEEADWVDATIVDSRVRILFGPGGEVTHEAGDYQTWVRITDNPERPVRKPDVVTVL